MLKVVTVIVPKKEKFGLTLLHSERPKLHRVLAVLSAIGLIFNNGTMCTNDADVMANTVDPDHTAALRAALIVYTVLSQC